MLLARTAYAEAAELAEEAANSLAPADGAALLRETAERCDAAGERALALKLGRAAHALVPAEGLALGALAHALYVEGAMAEAWPLFQSAAPTLTFEQHPDETESYLFAYADLAQSRGETKTAEGLYERVMREHPPAAVAVDRLAALWAPSRPREAVELLADFLEQSAASERVGRQLLALAARAKNELVDVELAARLLRRAAPMMAEPSEVHAALITLLRDAGRTHELMQELHTLASRALAARDLPTATVALEEEAQLAETVGRVDDALTSLAQLTELCREKNERVLAAEYERRRAEIFRDAKLDLVSAQEALEKSYGFYPDLRTAQLGVTLAARREDAAVEARWVEREVELATAPPERAHAQLRLAQLQASSLQSRDRAEVSAREALRTLPTFEAAETFLLRLLEEDGRVSEVAAYFEEQAARAATAGERSRLFRRAAVIYRDQAHRPDAAAAALLAARAADPDDLSLTAEAADLLFESGRAMDAAEFDALLLEQDPFRAPSYERHRAFLSGSGDPQALASLMLRRAERETGDAAAQSYLEAAAAFDLAGALERARLCEDQAFEQSPSNDRAFEALRARGSPDVRRLAALYKQRADAVPTEAPARLSERAQALSGAGEALLAAEAWDDVLAVSPDDTAALEARAELAAGSGGPRASQPYDRRLLNLAREALPLATLVRIQLRLGHAALAAGASGDAADAFEAVVALDADGERGREALSLLAEVYARTQNATGLYRISLELARAARGDEAEALYRRAAALFEDPREVIDALLPLAALRPGDAAVVDRTVEALGSLGRDGELLALYQRSAGATGGARAAELLLRAAALTPEPTQAFELTERAAALDPQNLGALRTLAEEYRRRGAPMALIGVLTQLIALSPAGDEASLFRLELAQRSLQEGDLHQARAALHAILERGASGAGYAEALTALEPLLNDDSDALARSDVLAARAELSSGTPRARLLFEASLAAERGLDRVKATRLCRAALADEATLGGFLLLARLYDAMEDPAKSAPALVQAAPLAEPDARGALYLRAAEAWERAGDPAEAQELVEKVAKEFPEVLSADEAAGRLIRLGAVGRALELGFGPKMERREFAAALALADGAQDIPRAEQALWALLESGEGAGYLARLLGAVLARGSVAQKLELADAAGAQRQGDAAVALYRSVLAGPAPLSDGEVEAASRALEHVMAVAPDLETLFQLATALEASSSHGWVEALLGHARTLSSEDGDRVLEQVAGQVPAQQQALWRELFERARATQNAPRALDWLQRLVRVTEDPRARAALNLELGELHVHALPDETHAREAFERVLTDDPSSVPAVRHLVSLYRNARDPMRYVAMVERLGRLAGAEAVAVECAPLAEAYEVVGRKADALRLLGELEETPERLKRRASLARELGLAGEALRFREKLVGDDAGALEEIGLGYLEQNLLPFAVRLGERLAADGKLSAASQRVFAERLANTREGAPLASRLWPALLRAQLDDADGWTLYAEALRGIGKAGEAELVDGLGAALTLSVDAVKVPSLRPVTRGPLTPTALPPGAVAVTVGPMSRLHATLKAALTGLGAPGVQVFLAPEGGVEAYLVSPDELVLGIGALAHFGPAELTFALGLALALGDPARKLATLEPIPELAGALAGLLDSVPNSLAAVRVAALMDGAMRGSSTGWPEAAQRLATLDGFRAIAARVLTLVE